MPSSESVVVAEMNAIRHSPLAEAILRCHGPEIDLARRQAELATGINFLEDVDRVAVSDGTTVVSGFFKNLSLPDDIEGRPFGDEAIIYASEGSHLARVGDDLLVLADDIDDLEDAIDRVEGRAEAEAPPIAMDGGGELYGPVDRDTLEKVLSDSRFAPLLDKVEGATVRALFDEHVALSVDFETINGNSAEELARMARGALAAVRMEAASRGDSELVEMLRESRIITRPDGTLALDVAVRGETILNALNCKTDGTPHRVEEPNESF